MELRLVAEPPNVVPRDVAADVDPDVTERAFVDALAAHLRLSASETWWAYCRRTELWLGDDRPASEAGLRQGDQLVFSPGRPGPSGRPERDEPSVDLVIIDGPEQGRRLTLAAGVHVVGREKPSDVLIAGDPRVSARHFRVRVASDGITVADEQSSNGTFVDGAQIVGEQSVAPGATIRVGRTVIQLGGAAPSGSSALGNAPGTGHERGILELVGVGGPASGLRFALTPGKHVVGRDSDADLAIESDPSMGARHFVVTVTVGPAGFAATIQDLDSRNGTWVDGERLGADEARDLGAGRLLRAGRSIFILEHRSQLPQALISTTALAHVPFNRPPRVARPYSATALKLEAPPDEPEKPRLSLVTALIPVALGGVTLLVLGLTGTELQGAALLMPLVFMAMSPVIAIVAFMQSRRSGTVEFKQRARAFRAKLAAFEQQLIASRTAEIEARRLGDPDAGALALRATMHLSTLWERRIGADDFLRVRVGVADQPSQVDVRLDQGGSQQLRAAAERVIEHLAVVPTVPVTVSLPEVHVLGITGPPERVDALGRWLAIQVATLRSPRDVVLAAAISPGRLAGWDWLKWLPHTQVDLSAIGVEPLASEPGAVDALLTALQRLVRQRRDETSSGSTPHEATRPQVVVLLDEGAVPSRSKVDDLLAAGGEHGVFVVWLGTDARRLPGECRSIIELDASVVRFAITQAVEGVTLANVTADGVTTEVARGVALGLAPLRDTSASKAGEGVPDSVSLLEILEMPTPSTDQVRRRWSSSFDHLGAPLGRTADSVFTVDLRRDGSHGLVVGTTGSGKSEMLLSFIAALAATHPPTRLTFMLIDGKGGATFKDCDELPHTVGYVTELDPHTARRALVSLSAEVDYRETVITQRHGAKDLRDLERADPAAAPPNLLIVIDEFGALATEMPEFIERAVEIGRKGRSLGMHFLLATQSSRGVVTEGIRANTNLRIALRTLNAAESQDVIERPDAASISKLDRGRAMVLTGRDQAGRAELTEVQPAYGGGRSGVRSEQPSIRVGSLAFGAVHWPAQAAPVASEDEATDLQRLVRIIVETARREAMAPQRRPWLPPLSPVVSLSALSNAQIGRGGETIGPDAVASIDRAAIGLIDEPARQSQRPLWFDLENDGNLLVYGAGGSGKTTVLRSLAAALASRSAPNELHIYGLDFATRGLKALESLPHCGSIIFGEDQERVERLFTLLARTVRKRKELLVQAGAANLAEHRAAGSGTTPPRILVLLDSYAGFVSAFERVNLGEYLDLLPRLIADGRPLGIHFAITAERRGAVSANVAGLISKRLILAMTGDEEYASFGLKPDAYKSTILPPGRGFTEETGAFLEFQCGVVGDDPSGSGQSAGIARLAQSFPAEFGAQRAPPIEVLPVTVDRERMPLPAGPLEAVVGIFDEELEPARISFAEGNFLVAGPYRSGRSTALATIALSLKAFLPDMELQLLAPRGSPLTSLAVWSAMATGPEACQAAAAALVEQIVAAAPDKDHRLFVIVDDGEELNEGPSGLALERIVRMSRDVPVTVIGAAESHAALRAYTGWLREVRKERHGLLLTPDLDADGDVLGMRLPRMSARTFPPGRGFLVQQGTARLIQVATTLGKPLRTTTSLS